MLAQFGIEASRAAQYVIAFAIILGLVALFGVVLRKLTGSRLLVSGQDRGRSRQPRLGVVDIYDLDRQRQLVLLRRDNVEHLLLIGGLNDVVIETNIVRVAGARLPAQESGAERFEPAFDQTARPQVEPSVRPSIETQLAAQLGAFIKRPSDESDIEEELAPVATASAPAPAHPEPILKPDAVTLGSAPAIHGLRAEAKSAAVTSAPPVPEPIVSRPEPRIEPRPAFTPPPFQSRPTPTPPPVAPQPQAPVPPPVQPPLRAEPGNIRAPQPTPEPAPAERAAPDAALLSNMAKQLEEALKRPAAPITPPAAMPPLSVAEEVVDEDELLEPPPPEHKVNAPVQSAAAPAAIEAEEDEEAEAPVQVAAKPATPAAEPARSAAAPAQPPRAPEPATAPKPAQKAPDPFSVEEIEAEFARLLGRPIESGKKE